MWALWTFLEKAIQQGVIAIVNDTNQIEDIIRSDNQGSPSRLAWPSLPRTWFAADNMWAESRVPCGIPQRSARQMFDFLARRENIESKDQMPEAWWNDAYEQAMKNTPSPLEQTLATWLLMNVVINESSFRHNGKEGRTPLDDLNLMEHPWIIANGADIIHRIGVLCEAMVNVPDIDGTGNYAHILRTTDAMLNLIATIIYRMEEKGDNNVWNDGVAAATWHDTVSRFTPLMCNGRESAHRPLRGEENQIEAVERIHRVVPELFVRMERHTMLSAEKDQPINGRRWRKI